MKEKWSDMHCHSVYSFDGRDGIDEMCRAALGKGLRALAFTEHLDFCPTDVSCGFYRFEEHLEKIENARKQFGGALEILAGIEFGEPYLYPEKFEMINEGPYDVILGGVHMIGPHFIGDTELLELHTLQDIYEIYYGLVLRAVESCSFDVLAHLGLPGRYYEGSVKDSPLLDEILKLLAEKEIALEINTSPLRKGCPESIPGLRVLRRYAELGGRMVTYGSDAHSSGEIAMDFEYADSLIKNLREEGFKLEAGRFVRRKFTSS